MSQPFIGEIRLFSYTFAPRGWVDCSGQLLAISQNDALFALLGTTYGGDGQNTFAVPDLRGRIPISQGQGPGLSNHTIGEQAGTETVTITSLQMPGHTHIAIATTAAASLSAANGALLGTVSGDTLYTNDATGLTPGVMAANSISGDGGGNQPHNNCMPTLTARFCIAVEGIFPSRN